MGSVIAVASLDPITMVLSKTQKTDGGGAAGSSAEVVPETATTGSGSVAGSSTQETEGLNPFVRKPMLARSPSKYETPKGGVSQDTPSDVVTPGPQETPKGNKGSGRKTIAQMTRELRDTSEQEGLSGLGRAAKLTSQLSQFIRSKQNIHKEILAIVTELERAIIDADKEWKIREESIKSQVEKSSETVHRKKGNTSKRSRSPRATPSPTKGKRVRGNEQLAPNGDIEGPWVPVENRKNKRDRKSVKPPEPKEKPRVRPRSDALVIGALDQKSYAEILTKIKGDSTLKELGSNVARIRRTQKGHMLLELRNDASVKSVAFKGVLEEALGGDATVRALTQEIVVECRNLDEVTTELELRDALLEQFPLGDAVKAVGIKLRKAYAGTQIATLKLPVAEANKLLEKGKIRVGWTICPLKIPERQLLRCFKCFGFGHKAGSCTGTDRSGRCFRCGDAGHVAKDCRGKPKCMLCQGSDVNHATGSLRCKAYLEAKARGGWR
jgi:Zinc knuckle